MSGVVYDSVAQAPLASAFVQLALVSDPTVSRSVRTDQHGSFRLTDVPAGSWAVAVMHPRLDALGIERLVRPLSTHGTDEDRIEVAIPSQYTLVRRMCGEEAAADSVGYVHGRLRLLTGTPATAVAVAVRWVDLTISVTGTIGVMRTPRQIVQAVEADGSFTVCGVPAGGTARVRGMAGTDTTGVVEVLLPDHGIARRDLVVGPVRHVALAPDTADLRVLPADSSLAGDRIPLLGRRGAGVLDGHVRGPGSTPLPNATLALWGSDLTTRTDASGRWQLRQLPMGTHTLETRALGYRLERVVVVVEDHVTEPIVTTLERMNALDTVRTTARFPLPPSTLRGFERRRESGLGFFRTPADMDEIVPAIAADVLRFIPGIRIIQTRTGDLIAMRGPNGQPCHPDIFVDGMRISHDRNVMTVDLLLNARDIRAVEVYSGLLGTPSEFARPDNACGVVVLWTGQR